MPTDLEKLVELQRVDLELARLNAQLAAIPKTIARIDAQLAAARKRVEDARAAIKAGESCQTPARTGDPVSEREDSQVPRPVLQHKKQRAIQGAAL